MCPTRFVPLFGTTGTITLPSDASFAFHILGNAISQSQATLCLAVGFAALFGLDVSPTMLVRQAWNDRLTSKNALVQVFEDWLTITRVQDIAVSMPCRSNLVPCEGHGVQIVLVHVPTHHVWSIRVPKAATLVTVFILAMFTKGICPDALQFRTLEGQTLQDIPVLEALALTSQVECLLWTFPLLWIRPASPAEANLERADPPADISPTVPFSPCVEEPLTLVLETVPPQVPSQELFQEMLHFLDFNATWKDNESSNKQLVSLLWENTLGVLTLKLDATVPAADLQEQLATHYGSNQFAIYQSPFAVPRIAPGPLFTVRPRNHSNDALVVFQKLQTEVWVRAHIVHKTLPKTTLVTTTQGAFRIAYHNNQACSTEQLRLANGDWLLIEPVPMTVVAGGHHRWTRSPETLPRGANFTARVFFSINTHGWAASDEIHAAMMWLHTRFPETIAEFNLLCWRTNEQEFNDELYGEPRFAESGRTVIAVLVDNHWAAVEVNRIGRHTQVHVFGLGAQFAQRALLMMCRCIDLAPHRVQQHIHPAQAPVHLCGWFLLQRYYVLCGALRQLPDYFDLFNALPAFRRAEIREAWESGQEDWRRAGANEDLVIFATTLRTNFLVNLAATATDTSSAVNIPLVAEFTPQTVTAVSTTPAEPSPPEDTNTTADTQQLQPPAPIQVVGVAPPPVQQHHPLHRIQSRLLECLVQPGWLSSDLLDHTLDVLRWQYSHVCFCPPAVWDSDRWNLRFLADLECLHETFSQLFLFVLWREHWILCEIHMHAWEVSIQTIGPLDAVPDSRYIVEAVCQLFNIHDLVLNTSAMHFGAAPGLCGWALLHTLFRRFQCQIPPLSQPWRAALRVHPYREIVARVQAVETAMWEANGNTDLLHFASSAALDFLVRIIQNRFPTERRVGGAISEVDTPAAVHHQPSSAGSVISQLRVQQRLELFDRHPGWLYSDTADYVLDFLREADPRTVYLPPMQWTEQGVSTFNELCTPLPISQKAIGLLLWDQHWILCEFQSTVCANWLFLTGPPQLRPLAVQCATDLCCHLGVEPVPHVVCRDFQAHPNLCGWTLLWLCFEKVGLHVHYPGPLQEASFLRSLHHLDVQRVLTNATTAWQQPNMHQAAFFAMRLLPWHILQVLQGRFPDQQAPGGAGDAKAAAKPKSSTDAADPLMTHDPWAKSIAASSRWEDLKLEDQHPFQDNKGDQLMQYHRLQTTSSTKGVVLATKPYLSEFVKLNPKQPLVVVLPLIDSQTKANSSLTFHGPFEVVLEDRATKTSYKRVVSAVPIFGEFQFRLRDPTYEFTMSEIAELVLELDSRLVQKHEFEKAKDNPIQYFKQYLSAAAPTHADQVSVYGFRHNRHPTSSREDDQLQVIAKLPSAARVSLLSLSGEQGVLLRDFLDTGSQPIDTSVIPKFWDVSQKGLRELSISIEGVKGVAGTILTRRGLAIRAWTANIADVRKKLLPNDARLNDTNINVVPRFMMDASGWPPGASPSDVIESVCKAVSQPPIPTRMFRSAGVHTWQLGFQTNPTVQTFTVKINGALHQILLTPSPQHPKGGGKGKQRQPKKTASPSATNVPPAVTSIAVASAQQDKKRIDLLEHRFDSLQQQVTGIERKQTSMESKLDQRFNDIGDTLRQLVQLSTNRTHEPSGETPPPKNQRTG